MLRIASPGAVPYHARPGSSGFTTEVSHATQKRTPRRPVLSRSQVRDGRGSPRRRESNGEHAWSAASRSSAKGSAATTHACAYQAVDFKNCCMLSGEFDGSDRHHRLYRSRPADDAGIGKSSPIRLPFSNARTRRTVTLCPRGAAQHLYSNMSGPGVWDAAGIRKHLSQNDRLDFKSCWRCVPRA